MFFNKKIRIVAIVGPTASGKTDLSIAVAKHLDGEIISADSRQMYSELTHGSGKISESEKENILHYCLDDFSIFEGQKSITDWLANSKTAIEKIKNKNKMPIVVGGTMHFIDALLFDQKFSNVAPDSTLRTELQDKRCEELVNILEKLDKNIISKIDVKNKVRLMRAIEIATELGHVPEMRDNENKYDVTWIGIRPDPELLRDRIDARLEKRWTEIVQEVTDVLANGLAPEALLKLGLEYKYATLYLQNKISEQEAKQEIKLKSWQYAKRQMTWWKRNSKIRWFASGNEALAYIIDSTHK